MITHRLNQTVSAAFVYEALAGGRHSHAGEGPRLMGVPPGAASYREAGGAVTPQWLTGAGGLVHQDHRGVDQFASASRGSDRSGNWSGSSCGCVGPGGRGHGGHAAGPRVQTVLSLTQEQR